MVTAVRSQARRALVQLLEECAELELEVRCLGSGHAAGPVYQFTIDSPPPVYCQCPGGCCSGGRINLIDVLHSIIGQAARHRILGEVIRFDDDQVVLCASRSHRSRKSSCGCNRQFHVRVKGALKQFGRC